jgi:hypothetical protein
MNKVCDLLPQTREKSLMAVSQDAAKLSGRQIQYPTTVRIDQKAALGSNDDTVQERLQQQQMCCITVPKIKVAGDFRFHTVNRL